MKTQIDITTATESQIERANKVISMGCKLPIEKVIEMEMAKDIKKGWRPMSKKEVEKMNKVVEPCTMTSAQIQDYNEQQMRNQMNLIR